MSRIKIFEMFLRDGLQSYPKIFTVPQKLSFINSLYKVNYDCIEFGSTTSYKLIPQVGGSFQLWEYIRAKKDYLGKTKYTMLVPSRNHLHKAIGEDISSFGLVTSISDVFSRNNMKMTADESLVETIEMIKKILHDNNWSHSENCLERSRKHIRVYISCSFGCAWEGFTDHHISKLKNFIDILTYLGDRYCLNSDQYDIVIADTIGLCDVSRIKQLLSINKDNKYLGLHMHFLGEINSYNRLEQKFEKIVDVALDVGIKKFDTSLLGIGGCPYAKKKDGQIIGNLSTVPFVKFLEKKGLATNLNIENLELAEFNIYKEMNQQI